MIDALSSTQGIQTAAEWAAILDHYQVHYLVLNTSDDQDLFEHFTARPGWTIELVDQESVLLSHPNSLARQKAEAGLNAGFPPGGQ
ncbi:hypothetical protein ACFLT5_01490 [Chloroflexota bacterium]